MRGSSVSIVNSEKLENSDQLQYYQAGQQIIDYYINQPGVTKQLYCMQWYLSQDQYNPGVSFTIEQADDSTFYLQEPDGSRIALGYAPFDLTDGSDSFALPSITPVPIKLTNIQASTSTDVTFLAPECLLIRIGMVGDASEQNAYGNNNGNPFKINFNGRTSNFDSVCLQFMSLSPQAANMFLDMFPVYKKMCCAGPIDQDLQGLLCSQYTIDGGPGNNANCDSFMSQEWCVGDQLNQPECACHDQAPITDEIDNDIFTAMNGSRPKRCVVAACQRSYIPSDTLNRQCTPLCVQVAKATADCGGTIKYNVQESMDCGNPNN
jgi:hypothetical protein